MFRDMLNEIMNYSNSYEQAHDVYNQAVAHIKKNYVKGSELYEGAMKTAKDTMNKALVPMKDMYRESIRTQFSDVKAKIQKAVAVAPSKEVVDILPLIRAGKMNDSELRMIMNTYGNNYMNSKMIADALGKTNEFRTVRDVMDKVDDLEARLERYIDTYAGSNKAEAPYNIILMQYSDLYDEADDVVNSFLTAYGTQEGGE